MSLTVKITALSFVLFFASGLNAVGDIYKYIDSNGVFALYQCAHVNGI